MSRSIRLLTRPTLVAKDSSGSPRELVERLQRRQGGQKEKCLEESTPRQPEEESSWEIEDFLWQFEDQIRRYKDESKTRVS
ncbi:hypothetical protein Tco_0370108 [Tanacetum coccineum]